jgi:predicted metal-dependent hydrolase
VNTNQSPSSDSAYDHRYLLGIAYFNDCDFFEAHEVWEELWADVQGPARRFYQGLIQAAVCLHHFGNGNTGGSRKLYHGCRGYLNEYAPNFLGLDLATFLTQLEDCCAEILASEEKRPLVEIVVDKIPEIHLDPPVELPELPESEDDDE